MPKRQLQLDFNYSSSLLRQPVIVKKIQRLAFRCNPRRASRIPCRMASLMRKREHCRLTAIGAGALLVAALLAVPARPQAQAQAQNALQNPAQTGPSSQQQNPTATSAAIPPTSKPVEGPPIKPDARKGHLADKQGLRAEEAGDLQSAFEAFSNAVKWAPDEQDYLMHREQARSRWVQSKADAAERAAVMGKLGDARQLLLEAHYLDPTNRVVRERLEELTAFEPQKVTQLPDEFDLTGEVHLDRQPGKRSISYRGTTQGAYEEVARQWGVDVAFDVDLQSRQVKLHTEDEDFPTTMRLLGDMTRTFWRPLQKKLFFVAPDTAQKRKDYAVQLVRTVVLPASATPQQMTELFRLVRDVAGITRAQLDTRSRTITMRASPQALAVATGVIDDLEQPVPELVLEIEVLEVDRTYAQTLGITPPQTSQVFTLTSQQIQEAEASTQGLITVIEQVLGTPGSVSGLTSSQVAGLLSSGQLGVGSLLPPIVLFGGGDSTFIATVPGASGSLAEMLNLVKTGRRILLRAEDGAPATFFVGERFPVTLAQFSPSLGGGAANIPGVSTSDFPETDLTTGNAPDFIASTNLTTSGFADLIVANQTDNTLSVFLGNGDGTFQAPISPPQATGKKPVWIATGNFNNNPAAANNDSNQDLAVVNNTDNTVSILLGNGQGGFTAAPTISTGSGTGPVSVAVADFNGDGFLDLAVANHNTNTVSIFLGNGDGTFSPPAAPKPATLTTGAGPSSVLATDLNGDGKPDLVVTNEMDNTVSVFLGNGDGTFGARTDNTVGVAPVYVVSADFNGDGIPDLAVANSGAPATDSQGVELSGNSVSILLGVASATNSAQGSGTFTAANSFGAGTTPVSLAVADFNLDGRPDIAVAASGDNAVALLLGVGDGTFGPDVELPVGTLPVSIVSADFNNDGRPDAALANQNSNTATVVLNEANFQGSTVNGLTGTPFPGVQYIDVGVKVKATPRVHPDDEVSLQLHFEVSALAGESVNDVPVISNESVDQTVRVKENETAVVAGFRQLQKTKSLNGTPGVSDAPGAGDVIGQTNTQNTDTEIVFMITPRLVSMPQVRKEHLIYAGRGAQEGPGAGPIGPPQREGRPLPTEAPEQPIQPQPAPPVQPRPEQQQPVPQQQPQPQQPQQQQQPPEPNPQTDAPPTPGDRPQ